MLARPSPLTLPLGAPCTRLHETRDTLVLEHPRGWPAAVGRTLLLTTGATVAWALMHPRTVLHGEVHLRAYWLEVAVLQGLAGLCLLLWRRGVIIGRTTGTVGPWWGFRGVRSPWVVRRGPVRPLERYTGLRVVQTGAGEHYKQFPYPVYQVQLEAATPAAGQPGLAERFVIDDEQPERALACETARRVARHLHVSVIEEPA